MLGVAAAAFGEQLFDPNSEVDPCPEAKDDVHRLACDWRLINKQLSSFQSYEDISSQWIDEAIEVRSASYGALKTRPFFLLTLHSGFAPHKNS